MSASGEFIIAVNRIQREGHPSYRLRELRGEAEATISWEEAYAEARRRYPDLYQR